MKKTAAAICFLFFSAFLFSQQPYWQQEVNYTIEVTLDDKAHTLQGKAGFEYSNNSPDTLTFIWFHLWPNAYKNETTAYARQIFRSNDGKKRWKDMKEKGSIDGLDFSVNGQKATIEPDPENIDIIKLNLPAPLLPSQKISISTPFTVKIPTYSSRSGRVDKSYIMCQWYPKPAVYDRKGWHPMPYLDQGEYYSEFGSFDVSITVPSTYVIGATGVLQNEDERNKYIELGLANNTGNGKLQKYLPATTAPVKTLRYKAEQVHDFAWFADKDFIIRYDTAQLVSGRVIDVFTYGYEKGNKHWAKSVAYVEDAVRRYSDWIGEYPYPVVQAVEGPRNVMSGGMEYPMITLITSPTADEPRLDAVIAHEVGHNWFYGVLGTNERVHAWLDEGINSYYQFRYEAEKYKANSIFGDMLPAAVKAKPLDEFIGTVYMALTQIPMEEAVETHSADFSDKEKYGLIVYLKAAVWMYIVELSVGKESLEKVMKAYYEQWKFKHPYPEDLKAIFEQQLGTNADKLFELLNKKGGFE